MNPLEQERRALRPRPEIDGLRPYRLAADAPVKLNQNESPLDWPEDLKTVVLTRLAARSWNRYPPAGAEELCAAMAAHVGVSPEMVAATNGSNEAILATIQAFATGKDVILTAPGYSMVGPLAVIGGARGRPVLLRSDFSLDVRAITEAAGTRDAAVVFLASPNNPTGNAFARDDIEAILDAAQGLVVVDEAYADFTGDSFIPDLRRHPHLVVLRTFSKAFALAGARIGWVVGGEDVVAALRKALPPYNLNLFAQEAALAALEQSDLVASRVDLIVQERTRLLAAMRAIDGVAPYPSQTNFFLFRTPLPSGTLLERLAERGVLVRDVSAQPVLMNCLRVTVGLPEHNDRFLSALKASLENVA